MEPDSEDTRRIFEPLWRWWEVKRECTMKGGEMEDVAGAISSWPACGLGVLHLLYIFTSSSHFGPSLKSSVAK